MNWLAEAIALVLVGLDKVNIIKRRKRASETKKAREEQRRREEEGRE